MSKNSKNPSGLDDDMSEYLQTFLDETEEQLDDLVETLLSLEKVSTSAEDLNEAFRLIHSIKGSAGMMGLNQITVLTHQLENRFERFRSGTEQLDEPTMTVVLRCIDFLRQCNDRLRDGEALGSPTELLSELKQLEEQAVKEEATPGTGTGLSDAGGAAAAQFMMPTADEAESADRPPLQEPSVPTAAASSDPLVRMVVRFLPGLPLADLKAQLIINRLAGLADLKSTLPALDALPEGEPFEEFEILLETDKDLDRLRSAAEVDGVESIDFPANPAAFPSRSEVDESNDQTSLNTQLDADPDADGEPVREPVTVSIAEEPELPDRDPATDSTESAEQPAPAEAPAFAEPVDSSAEAELPAPDKATARVAETMRVEIDRLDSLMNLAGELVVNRARFVQISGQLNPAHRKASTLNRFREFCDSLRHTIDRLEDQTEQPGDRDALLRQLRYGVNLMDEHSRAWEHDRGYLEQFGEAIDQLSRVSQNLQKGVLDTRMVPVAPLFNRFKRVVRDLSRERGKRVNLLIRGEKTELDKRMIDALGDPLVHLVRNSIDHGLESPQARLADGKPEAGMILLEAKHSGNNVDIHIRDDGRGIDVAKIKAKLISNQVLSKSAAAELSDEQALDYIWHPGFSTAREITDVSGRGVGMDAVLNRIRKLNGSIEVESVPGQGTHFTIRLPLTLAIIHCLLVKIRGVVFSMPIDEVREIVSVHDDDVITLQGKRTFDVRDEFIPLVSIDDIFHWRDISYGHEEPESKDADEARAREVVVVQIAGKTMGLQVDELLGSQDMVIRSLSDNFIDIRGLSGASILGDGSVSLMLDVGTAYQMATQPSMKAANEELAS